MARQMLSIFLGDAIDAHVVRRLRALTSEHSVARTLLSIRSALWPGGVWYAWSNQQRQQRLKSEATKAVSQVEAKAGVDAEQPGPSTKKEEVESEPWVPVWEPPPAMQEDRFLEPASRLPDEQENSRKLLERLLAHCPAAATALIGARQYAKSVTELHAMLQSSTFMLQIGYGVLEAVLESVTPEMGQVLRNEIRDAVLER